MCSVVFFSCPFLKCYTEIFRHLGPLTWPSHFQCNIFHWRVSWYTVVNSCLLKWHKVDIKTILAFLAFFFFEFNIILGANFSMWCIVSTDLSWNLLPKRSHQRCRSNLSSHSECKDIYLHICDWLPPSGEQKIQRKLNHKVQSLTLCNRWLHMWQQIPI